MKAYGNDQIALYHDLREKDGRKEHSSRNERLEKAKDKAMKELKCNRKWVTEAVKNLRRETKTAVASRTWVEQPRKTGGIYAPKTYFEQTNLEDQSEKRWAAAVLAAVKKVNRRFEAVDFFQSTRAGGTIYYNVHSRSEEVTEPDLVGLQAKEEMRLLQERVERKMEAFMERKQTVTSLRVLSLIHI